MTISCAVTPFLVNIASNSDHAWPTRGVHAGKLAWGRPTANQNGAYKFTANQNRAYDANNPEVLANHQEVLVISREVRCVPVCVRIAWFSLVSLYSVHTCTQTVTFGDADWLRRVPASPIMAGRWQKWRRRRHGEIFDRSV